MPDKSAKNRLPFEPNKNKKKKTEKKAPQNSAATKKAQKKSKKKSKRVSNPDASLSAIPKAVSRRMARRMAVFSGIPTFLGISSFFIFYWLFSQDILEFPPYLVVFFSAGFFGLGVVGLSYGIFSASWDEDRAGGIVGAAEFKTNFDRTINAWKSERQKKSSS
ncbi:MAG: PAM68 family protein [Cyanobacteria bacterium P01_F01_bin.143]